LENSQTSQKKVKKAHLKGSVERGGKTAETGRLKQTLHQREVTQSSREGDQYSGIIGSEIQKKNIDYYKVNVVWGKSGPTPGELGPREGISDNQSRGKRRNLGNNFRQLAMDSRKGEGHIFRGGGGSRDTHCTQFLGTDNEGTGAFKGPKPGGIHEEKNNINDYARKGTALKRQIV